MTISRFKKFLYIIYPVVFLFFGIETVKIGLPDICHSFGHFHKIEFSKSDSIKYKTATGYIRHTGGHYFQDCDREEKSATAKLPGLLKWTSAILHLPFMIVQAFVFNVPNSLIHGFVYSPSNANITIPLQYIWSAFIGLWFIYFFFVVTIPLSFTTIMGKKIPSDSYKKVWFFFVWCRIKPNKIWFFAGDDSVDVAIPIFLYSIPMSIDIIAFVREYGFRIIT